MYWTRSEKLSAIVSALIVAVIALAWMVSSLSTDAGRCDGKEWGPGDICYVDGKPLTYDEATDPKPEQAAWAGLVAGGALLAALAVTGWMVADRELWPKRPTIGHAVSMWRHRQGERRRRHEHAVRERVRKRRQRDERRLAALRERRRRIASARRDLVKYRGDPERLPSPSRQRRIEREYQRVERRIRDLDAGRRTRTP